jgi:hypothetical protein
MRLIYIKAKDFERKFDAGEDVVDYLDLRRARRGSSKQEKINIDIPGWMLESLDREASRLGVTRQAIIKVWLAVRLDQV